MKNIFLLIFLIFSNYSVQCKESFKGLMVEDLKCEYLNNPLGIDITQPRFSWKLVAEESDKNVMQEAYQIQVVSGQQHFNKEVLWDSEKVNTDESIHVVYVGPALSSFKRYFWRVRVWDNKGRASDWSDPAFWEMGLLDRSDWKAEWITVPWKEKEKALNPCPIFRKEYEIKKKIKDARIYITSHGNYDLLINGKKVTKDLFTPGWTSYKHRLQYQTYDIGKFLKIGNNAVGVTLGDGWYRGQFGFRNNWNIYGTQLALLCQIEVSYEDGTKATFGTDENWRTNTGPIIYSSIYHGEMYDAGKEYDQWSLPSFDDRSWQKAMVNDSIEFANLVAPQGPPVRKMDTIDPIDIIVTPKGEQVIDFGQNMVGWIKLKVKGNRGDTVTLYHAEVLDKDGNFYTDNLRSAKQKTTYILKGGQEEIYEPTFTFQGFRYVQVVGFPGTLKKNNLQGIVIYSQMEKTGSFECSDSLVNQLQSNILWGQKGNFLDVPTDCPQRDERMGWTGDAQAFAPTACYNFDAAAFFTKWLGDLKADQSENGSVPFVVPDVLNAGGSTGWGDAATIIPWTIYQKYGDKRLLQTQYQSMKNWVIFLEELAGDDRIVQDGFHFGDWLFFIHPTDWNAKPGYSDIDFLATAFLAHSAQLVSKAATVLNNKKDRIYFQELFVSVKKAFQKEFITPSGRISPHSQTAYTLALTFNLLEEYQIDNAVEYLVKDIEKRNHHLSTGFLGTPHLCKVLTDHGRTDIAYKLLLQTSYPSWLYPVTRGATTIWERWDGIKPDSSFQTTQMNSFNHYAYGAIGHWLYSEVAGVQMDENQPGYKQIIIDPHVDPSLTFVKTKHQSLYGTISSEWKLEGEEISIQITIPVNTKATIHLPLHPEGEKIINEGSGKHAYKYKYTK